MKKRIIRLLLLCIFVLTLLAGCGGSAGSSAAGGGASNGSAANADGGAADPGEGWNQSSADMAESQPASTITPALRNAKIILTGNMDLQSQNFDDTDAFLRQLTAGLGGYLEATSVSGDIGYRYADYTVRVPQASYDTFFAQVGQKCHVLGSSSQTQNITEEYVDLEARLTSLQTKHGRLIALLEKADSMETIVTLESELADTEYEIERLTGSLRKYDNLVGFSTVYLTLNEVRTLDPVADGNSFLSELGQAFQNGGRGLVSFLRAALLFAAAAWPVLLIAVVAAVVALLSLRRRKAAEDAALSVKTKEEAQIKKESKKQE